MKKDLTNTNIIFFKSKTLQIGFLSALLFGISCTAFSQRKVQLKQADQLKGGRSDAGRFERLLGNVIFTQNKTTIFYVQDNGIGLAAENQALVFERFYRVLGTQQEGCGLGLTIVHEIAERHHATVSVTSEGEGKGTLFLVCFSV